MVDINIRFVSSTLGEVIDESGGEIKTGPFGSQLHQSDYQEEGVPVVMPQDLKEDKISVGNIARIGHTDVERLSVHKLSVGDIVYGRRGDIGKRAIVTETEVGWICGTGCLRIRVSDGKLLPYFLYYFLGQKKTVAWIYNQAIGATMPNLNTSILRSVPITFPPLPTQQKISSVLSAYDDLIENNERRIKILEEMAQSIYREWFINYRFPGHENVKMVDSELGEIPEGWDVSPIGEIAKVKGGKRLPQGKSVLEKETNYPYLRVTDFTENGLDSSKVRFIDSETYRAIQRYTITADDIYISIAGTIGRVGIIPSKYSGANLTENAAKICEINPVIDKYYLLQFLRSVEGQKQIASKATGTSQPKLALYKIQELKVLIPPSPLMDEIAHFLADSTRMSGFIGNANNILRQTRDLLLPKLISGELDVEELDIVVA